MARWSKLQKQLYQLRCPGLNLQLHCSVHRMRSRSGDTPGPRYWVTLDKETIWDFPRDFSAPSPPGAQEKPRQPAATDMSAISALIREYIDTPRTLLMKKRFENDMWGLVDILKAGDRRFGNRQLPALREAIRRNRAALKVLDRRLGVLDPPLTQEKP